MSYDRLVSVVASGATAAVVLGLVATTPVSADASAPAAHSAGNGQVSKFIPTISAAGFRTRTLDNPHGKADTLSAINRRGVIAGWYDTTANLARSFLLRPPYRHSDYVREDVPHSTQTEVLGLNDKGILVGTYTRGGNIWYGFWAHGGHFHKVDYPTGYRRFNDLTGVNDAGIAVGTYIDRAGRYHAFRYNIFTRDFSLPVTGAVNAVASNINNKGAVVGYFRRSKGPWVSYVTHLGHLVKFNVQRAGQTTAQGINDNGTVVGGYTMNGTSLAFIRSVHNKLALYYWSSTNKSMTINGINDAGEIVGTYTGKKGRVNGFLGILKK